MAVISHLFLKCAGTLVLFCVTVLFGVLPVKFIKKHGQGTSQRQKTLIGLCNCFAGGVFFSTCLLDLLPMVRDKITAALQEVDIFTHFPLGEFIASFGFLLMLATELIVHSLGKDDWLGDHAHVGRDMDDMEHTPLLHGEERNGYGAPAAPSDAINTNSDKNKRLKQATPTSNGNHHKDHAEAVGINEPFNDQERPASPERGDEITFISNMPKRRLKRSKSVRSLASANVVVHSSFRIYILIIALSLHSLFEGLSVGLVTDVDTLVQILIALLIHKSILSFALGVKLVDGGLAMKKVIKGIILFAAMAPVGVGLGLAVLTSFSRVVNLFFSGILQGIATGSFLYVTFFEILPEEFNISNTNKGRKVISVMFGFFIIAGMCYYENQFYHIKKVIPKKKP